MARAALVADGLVMQSHSAEDQMRSDMSRPTNILFFHVAGFKIKISETCIRVWPVERLY